ncbi:MAG: dTMP kinase [Candidatus Komeilibacteria bacterium]
MKSVFINFEGIDGCGKDTQIALLTKRLQEEGYQLFVGLEPTYTFEPGKRIRKILTHELPAPEPEEMQYLYYEDRKEHVDKMIRPALNAGVVVVENRYMFSTMAYGTAFGVDYDLIRSWHDNMPIPNLNFYLDIPAEVGVKRVASNGKPEYFDKVEFLEKIDRSYKEIWLKDEWRDSVIIIDGEKSIEEIHEKIWEIVKEKLV